MIKLRELNLEDIDAEYINWFKNDDGHLDFYSGSGRVFSQKDLVEQYEQSKIDGRNVFFIIETIEGQKIGNVRIGPIDKRNKSSDLVCLIGNRNFLGKGLATRAIKLASEHAFKALNIHRLHSGIVESNQAAVKAYTHAGWSVEAMLEDFYFLHGKYQKRVCISYINKGE